MYSFSFRPYRDSKPVRDDSSHQKTGSSLLIYKRHLQVRKSIMRCERVSAKRSAMLVELAGGTHSALCRWLRRACPPCKVQDLSSYALNVVTVELLMNR